MSKQEKAQKAELVAKKIRAMNGSNLDILCGMLDEWKLDAIMLALGDGKVVPRDDQ